MNLYRPKFVVPKHPIFLTKKVEKHRVVEQLHKERDVILADEIQTGLAIFKYLQVEQGNSDTYEGRKLQKKQFQKYAKHILISIKNNEVQLQKKLPIPILFQLLYTEIPEQVYVSLLDFQDLHQASLRFEEGIFYSVLGHKIHPFFGAYAPTRTSHLELFTTWLQQYTGSKECVYDIGVGSGILSFLLAKRGFQNIIATDSNPNAIESVQRDIETLKQDRPYVQNIFCFQGEFFASQDKKADLIVCNPPWMQGEVTSTLDAAMYFEEGFFEVFFEQAFLYLKERGKLVVIFSNIIDLVTPDVGHPIQKELESQRFSLVQKMQRKVRSKREKNKKTREKVEVWELQKKKITKHESEKE